MIQFFLGTYDMDMNYIDDFAWIVKKNLFSINGFWFDCMTSIPWSCFDLVEFMVCHTIRPPVNRLCLTKECLVFSNALTKNPIL